MTNAIHMIKETGCDCVKLEGGINMADKIAAIVNAGIPVMGHIGLTPQTATSLGGFKVQGGTLKAPANLLKMPRPSKKPAYSPSSLSACPVVSQGPCPKKSVFPFSVLVLVPMWTVRCW